MTSLCNIQKASTVVILATIHMILLAVPVHTCGGVGYIGCAVVIQSMTTKPG